jgi:hypothetical protein
MGDFSIARFVKDRNNDNFDVRAADDLNAFIDELELQELPLLDRRFTWSNRHRPHTGEAGSCPDQPAVGGAPLQHLAGVAAPEHLRPCSPSGERLFARP